MVFQSERVTCCGSKTNCGGGWSESTGHDLRMTELPMNPAAVLKALAEARELALNPWANDRFGRQKGRPGRMRPGLPFSFRVCMLALSGP